MHFFALKDVWIYEILPKQQTLAQVLREKSVARKDEFSILKLIIIINYWKFFASYRF